MRTRKSRVNILLFVIFIATWLGLPLDENTRSLQENDSREMYTFHDLIEEEVDPSIETKNFKTINRNTEEKSENKDEDESGEEELSVEVTSTSVEVTSTSVESPSTSKPVMYTFYEETPNGCCGMTAEGHQKLLAVWEKSWEDRGWETKVLTKEDAMKHVDFEMLEEKLKKLGVGEYNRRCYWRWLAMAAIEGGGWMSDYDLFPLQLSPEKGNAIAKDGTFKSFALHVPCLIHASREEWDRIIHLMIDELPDEKSDAIVTDMYSLMNLDLARGRSKMKWSNQVAPSFIYAKNRKGELQIECWRGRKLAIHLSHSECDAAVKKGRYPITDQVRNAHDAVRLRADAAELLMHDYNNECQIN